MLVYLADYLSQFHSGFNVFQYLTLRAILGVLTALLLSFVIGPEMIRRLGRYQIGQPIRDDGPETHLIKAGTPTMGGALILVAVAIATLLWADLGNRYVWVVLLVTLLFGVIGWIDDYRKLVLQDSAGLQMATSDQHHATGREVADDSEQLVVDTVRDLQADGKGIDPVILATIIHDGYSSHSTVDGVFQGAADAAQ